MTMTTTSVGTTIFVWIVFIVLLPLLPLLVIFDILLHLALGVPIVFPWQVDLHTSMIKGTKNNDGVNNDNQNDYGGTAATDADNNESNGGGDDHARRRAREDGSGKVMSFDEIIDVRSPSEYKWFRIDESTNVPFDTDVSSWKRRRKESAQGTVGTTTARVNQQEELKEEQEKLKDREDNQIASEDSKLKSTLASQSKPKTTVLLVCMSGHRSPLMAYFLNRNDGDDDDDGSHSATTIS
mmetsp:Transcript_27286/g.65343  ORF Transcript_27286/g.65343 Transcript_27286/m.65343 type:complete len:239 (+) Transcript_27286:207-923(+)